MGLTKGVNMADINIEIGTSDGYRYLGVQPPLTEDQQRILTEAHATDPEIPSNFQTVTPTRGEPFSETSTTSGRFDSTHDATRYMFHVAHKLSALLSEDGSEVEVNGRPQRLGFNRHLFSEKFERQA